ncbi:B3 domain-containing transcription factor VRN1 isoform X1 [Hevea brasiliensis]|uniref:B3 domain-containing transcription factor VRN1 isoform X1 n=1 Tax=Hevea brasiliensis TaxID=3981 RepID=UPI0025F6B0D2|nr:B3 domain-containing transcription factor VRN1 isoform X1 [Hevea brasiliensis]
MASSSSKRDMFEADRPHFFKIILKETIHDKKLGIPRRFVRKYGKDLKSPALLQVPSGRIWKVELTKCDGEVWLHNGWQEFLEYYSLAYGSFLVFEYSKRNCHFNVIIFDKTASEIYYPISFTNGDDEEPNNLQEEIQEPRIIQETENDASVEILDDLPCRKRKEKPPLSFPLPQKMTKVENPTGNRGLHCPERQDEGNRVFGGISAHKQTPGRIIGRKRRLGAKEKTEALRRASTNFKSENPFFLIAMQPSYVHPGEKMTIPASFSVKYFPMKHSGDATLNLDGRTWPVKFYICNKAKNGKTLPKITQGWRAFAIDNHLEVGDVCAFELIMITGSKATFKVTIFRRNKGNKHELKDEERHSPGAIEAAKSFTSVHPFFKSVISPGHMENHNMHVPQKFISNIKQSSEKVKLQVENRCWLVKLNFYPQIGKGNFTSGWSAFVRENSVRVGDVCIFELINRKSLLVKVTIFRNVK